MHDITDKAMVLNIFHRLRCMINSSCLETPSLNLENLKSGALASQLLYVMVI